ncbi:MAG: phosphate ABC transporter permease PstA [Candidatus Ratteibacteria bacterium]|nr:phosphate ABC transporter permease PstA [Candidatus Ratteibacteria bacterium]
MKYKKTEILEKIGFSIVTLCIIVMLLFLGLILYFITVRGIKVISWEFLTQQPRSGMTEGGIAPAIVGTFYLTLGAILFAVPIGVGCAIYLNEYTPKNIILNLLRISVNNLAGIPSIIFGLFGLAVFVKLFRFGVSILSGSLTLGILILPSIISASQETLMAIPNSLREASLALGATKWQTIKKIVVPAALPGILTGIILSTGRAAGETAAILFTAAAFYVKGFPGSIFSEVMALPYHIYGLMTEGIYPDKQISIAYGCALILMFLVLIISAIAIYFRQKQRRTYYG